MNSYPSDYPEEYITGKVNFFGRDFTVTPDVLIPRLETESLVRRARNILQWELNQKNTMMKARNGEPEGGKLSESDDSKYMMSEANEFFPPSEPFDTFQLWKVWHQKKVVVDIWCGSGIIGISIADLADEVIFLDISPEALRVAKENFRTHFPDKKAQFIISDLLSNLPTLQHSNILFLTNLPYIRDEDWKNMSADTIHEPKLALFWWEKTGFELYERLFEELDSVKLWNCNSVKLLYEFWFDQREVAEAIVKKYPHWEYSFFADYAGVERFGEVKLR